MLLGPAEARQQLAERGVTARVVARMLGARRGLASKRAGARAEAWALVAPQHVELAAKAPVAELQLALGELELAAPAALSAASVRPG